MQLGMNLLYPTPVLKTTFRDPAVQERLLQALITNVNLVAPTQEKLGENLLDVEDPAIAEWVAEEVTPVFDEYLQQALNKSLSSLGDYEFKAWLTGTQGNYNLMLHNHSGATLSAVFYVLAEEQNQGGELVFCDPRTNANRGNPKELREMFDYTKIQPQTGDVFVFPSYLYHFVTPYLSNLRLCVPVDLIVYGHN